MTFKFIKLPKYNVTSITTNIYPVKLLVNNKELNNNHPLIIIIENIISNTDDKITLCKDLLEYKNSIIDKYLITKIHESIDIYTENVLTNYNSNILNSYKFIKSINDIIDIKFTNNIDILLRCLLRVYYMYDFIKSVYIEINLHKINMLNYKKHSTWYNNSVEDYLCSYQINNNYRYLIYENILEPLIIILYEDI